MRNATSLKMADVSLIEFINRQILVMNPATAPVWLAGLAFCLFSATARPWRILGYIYLSVFAVLALSGTSRAAYLSPAYPMLLASGGVAIETFLARRSWLWARAAVIVILIAGGALLAPFALPVLPVDSFIRYSHVVGITPPAEERSRLGELPQQYADMFGWEEMAQKVAGAFNNLATEERAMCVIFAQNYGEAGAIQFFGRKLGLPRVVSGHNSYWLWGPGDGTAEVVIVLGGDAEDNRNAFLSLEQVDTIACELCMPYERDLPVYVGRGLKVPVEELWPQLKRYI